MTRNLTYISLLPKSMCFGGVVCPNSQSRRSYAENSVNTDICAIFRGGYFVGYQVVAKNIERLWLRCRLCRMTPPELVCI